MNIIIVDRLDKEIGLRDRNSLNYEKDIYRVSALWITNSKGQILLAKRALTKKHNPGAWGPAVAGTVEEGETYDSNIIKEAYEELGLTNLELKKGPKFFDVGLYRHFTQYYPAVLDKNLDYFKVNKEEVAEIRWFTKKNIIEMMKTKKEKFTTSIEKMLKEK